MKNKKSLGQHWLKNRQILDYIAQTASQGLNRETTLCVEIGPGLGTLTSSLLREFPAVTAIEYDADLASKLPQSFPGKNLHVLHADVLSADFADIIPPQPSAYVVVGNIPYYITSPIVKKVLSLRPQPQKIVLLMQKEVAERIAAPLGKQNLLSLFVQNQAQVELGDVVPAAEFTPPPKVDSQVIIITPFAAPIVSDDALAIAKRGFFNPRKKLLHNLADFHFTREEWQSKFAHYQINPDARPADLSLRDWQNLADSIA